MTATPPLVSVVMSVRNGEKYLREAVDSILSQTFADFEFIIINDGSTDTTAQILSDYQKTDNRIRVLPQANRGLIASLNRGCSTAEGKYIARMDADDISLPSRLGIQVKFMETHPEIGIVGGWAFIIDKGGRKQRSWRPPIHPATIKWSLMFGSCLIHPSVMMRREIIKDLNFYQPHALNSEDYDLWARASRVTDLSNIPEILIYRRVWEESITSQKTRIQETNSIKIMHSQMTTLLSADIPLELVGIILQVRRGNYRSLKSLEEIKLSIKLITQLYSVYQKTYSLNHLESKEIRKDIARELAILATGAGKISVGEGLTILAQAIKFDTGVLLRFIARATTRLMEKFDV